MAIAIIGNENIIWDNKELISTLVDSLLKSKVKIITGYGRGTDAMVRASLFEKRRRTNCCFYDTILNEIQDGKKVGLIAFINEPCPNYTKPSSSQKFGDIWSLVAKAIFINIPVVVFSENTMPQWNGGRWGKAGVGHWESGVKWVKGDLLK